MIQSTHSAGEQKHSLLTGSPQAHKFIFENEATVQSFYDDRYCKIISAALLATEKAKALKKQLIEGGWKSAQIHCVDSITTNEHFHLTPNY